MARRYLVAVFVVAILGFAWYRVLRARRVEGERRTSSFLIPKVEAVEAKGEVFLERLEISGVAEAKRTVLISTEVPGKVESVLVQEGQIVKGGQLLVLLEDSAQRSAVTAARAEVEAARATLSQALARYGSLSSKVGAEVENAKASVKTALSRFRQVKELARMEEERASAQERSAREELRAAKARLELLKRGAREEELSAAEARLKAAESSLKDAKKMEGRMKRLYEEGAVSERAWEEAKTKVEVLKAEVEAAKAQLDTLKKGARKEEIEAAEAEVGRAQAALEGAIAGKGVAEAASQEVEAARAQLDMARANLALALARELELEAAKEEVDLWRARLKAARAQLDQAIEGLRRTRIEAPISGVVIERKVEPGQVISPGVPILALGEVATVIVKGFVAEEELGRVKVGERAEVEFDALPGKVFIGKVSEVSPTADLKTGKFPVKVSIGNKGGLIRPGMTAEVRINLSSPRRSVSIPERVVRGGFVWVVEGGVAKKRKVALGLKEGEAVEVLSGVREGELVVVEGTEGLREGQRVEVEVRQRW